MSCACANFRFRVGIRSTMILISYAKLKMDVAWPVELLSAS